jgi:hypothetical protein
MIAKLLLAAAAALALGGPALAGIPTKADYLCGTINGKHLCTGDAASEASGDPNEDPLLGPKAQGQLKNYHLRPVDPVALAIVGQFRECVAEEPWRKGLPRTGVVLTDDCYRVARGLH